MGRPPLPVQRRPRTTKPSTSRYDAVHQPSNYDVVHQPLPRRPQAITIKVHQPLQRRPQAITIKVHQPLPQPPQRGPQATSPSSTSHDNAVHKPLRRRPAPHNHTAPSMPRGGARRRPLEPALPDGPQLPMGERTARAWQRWFRAIKVNQGRLTPKPGLPGEEAIFPDPRVFTSAQFSVEAVQGLKGDCLRLTVSAVRNLHFDKKSWNPQGTEAQLKALEFFYDSLATNVAREDGFRAREDQRAADLDEEGGRTRATRRATGYIGSTPRRFAPLGASIRRRQRRPRPRCQLVNATRPHSQRPWQRRQQQQRWSSRRAALP